MNRMVVVVITWILIVVLGGINVQAQWTGTHYYVNPQGDDDNDGLSPNTPLHSIQQAINLAQPGDTIHLADGHYYQDVSTVRDGEPDAPITIVGSTNAVVHGQSSNRIFQVHHNYITLIGFTIDGLRRGAEPDRMGAYHEKLLYVIGYTERDGVQGLRVLHMTFRNAGEECLRIKYFAHHNEIAYNHFQDCGIWDFVYFAHGVVGEAIYIGTSSNQWNINLTNEPDRTNFNWIHHNYIVTNGNECVEAKEGTQYNIIEYNVCSGQRDVNSAGIVSRGDNNIIRHNQIFDNLGAGIRLGGHVVDGVQYGVNNHVYGNVIYGNAQGGIKFMVAGQGVICGNTFSDNEMGITTGTFRDLYDPTIPCTAEMMAQISSTP